MADPIRREAQGSLIRTTTLAVPHTTIESIERRLRNLRELQGAIARAQQGLQAGLTLAAQEFEALDALLRALNTSKDGRDDQR